MGLHARIWFTPNQKAEIWERWKSGQCVADIARGLERLPGLSAQWRDRPTSSPERSSASAELVERDGDHVKPIKGQPA
jgi:hypothetical protein